MIELISPESTVKGLCGKQKKRADLSYRLSTLCVNVPVAEGNVLFHTLTNEALFMERNESLPDHEDALIEKWFLVPEGFDEEEWVKKIRYIASAFKNNTDGEKTFTIFTTTDCNARCYYCYEKDYKHADMSEQTALDTAEYIRKACRGNEVKLHWFGGEPLMNIPVVDIITSELGKYGIKFTSVITTNGYFLDKEVTGKVKNNWNTEFIQITVDGTREVYNRTKAYINNDVDAFERVMNNIGYLLDDAVPVVIRLNVGAANAEDLLDLCEKLADRFGSRDGFTVYPEQLREFVAPVGSYDSELEAAEKFIAVWERIIDLGLNSVKPLSRKLRINSCMADDDSSVAIYPDGSLGKCEHYDIKHTIGSIYETKHDTIKMSEWSETVDFPECKGCHVYPFCINLKLCEWSDAGCPESRKIVKQYKLKQQMLATIGEAQTKQ